MITSMFDVLPYEIKHYYIFKILDETTKKILRIAYYKLIIFYYFNKKDARESIKYNYNFVKFIYDNCASPDVYYKLAIIYDDIRLLSFILNDKRNEFSYLRLVKLAIHYNKIKHLEIINLCIKTKYDIHPLGYYVQCKSIKYSNIDVLEWLYENYKISQESIFHTLCYYEHSININVIEWILNKEILDFSYIELFYKKIRLFANVELHDLLLTYLNSKSTIELK
jgi:hypothetical protein